MLALKRLLIGAPVKQQTRSLTTYNTETPYQICFLRHGQSTWNRDNRFIGWTDAPLTDDGVLEARVAGQMLLESKIRFDECHTSLLRRSIRTANLALMSLEQEYIPVHKHWRLNERSYGALVGLNKKQVVQEYGAGQVKLWRRSHDVPPPPMVDDHPFHPKRDLRYQDIDVPTTESLQDTLQRAGVYWDEAIAPKLHEGKTLLVVGHENCLRAIIMKLEEIAPEDIISLSLPRAVPLAYQLDENLKPVASAQPDPITHLRGTWLGGTRAVEQILERDDKQVYDTTIEENLEPQGGASRVYPWSEQLLSAQPLSSSMTDITLRNSLEASSPAPGVKEDTLDSGGVKAA